MKSASLMPTTKFRDAVLPRRSVSDGQFLDPSDPAIHAITDFTREHPVTVDEERQIDDALHDMIHLGVRAMLVVREQRIVGLITSYDIQGERPLQFLQTSTYTRHQDIRVGHIMTPWDKLLAVDWESVQSARAGDLLHVLEEAGITHLLVIEAGKKNSAPIVRALVSRARLSRQLRGLRLALEPDDGGDPGERHQQRTQ
jgi:CBS domain-containing protein